MADQRRDLWILHERSVGSLISFRSFREVQGQLFDVVRPILYEFSRVAHRGGKVVSYGRNGRSRHVRVISVHEDVVWGGVRFAQPLCVRQTAVFGRVWWFLRGLFRRYDSRSRGLFPGRRVVYKVAISNGLVDGPSILCLPFPFSDLVFDNVQ